MKIALLIPDNRDEARDYADPHPRFGPAPTALLEGFAETPNCEIHIVSCVHRPVASPAQLSANVFYHSIVVPKPGWRPTAYRGCITAIRQTLRKIRPDIVHGQGTERYCALAAALSGWPNVITIHGNMLGMAGVLKARIGSFYWFAAKFESFALRRTDGVFCNSLYTERMVGSRTSRTWRIPNAVRQIFFEPLPARIDEVTPILLNIGSIGPHKCQIEILEVARRLFHSGHIFQIQFIGGFPAGEKYGESFMKLLEHARREGWAEYVTSKSQRDLLKAYDRADAIVHFPREEAFGLVVAEAMCRNLKFFGARTGGIPDITEGVESANLYDREDWDGLYGGLARWLASNRKVEIASAGLMKERYHPSVIARRHIEIYHDVLANR